MERCAKLVRYAAGERQAPHAHEYSTLSLLLSGEVQEVLAGTEYDLLRPVMGWKPAGVIHGDRFGPHGAMLASIRVPDEWCGMIDLSAGWYALDAGGWAGRLVRICLAARPPASAEDACADLFGIAAPPLAPARANPPPWLRRARERLRDEPATTSIAGLARAHGVHRVHFSRAFTRCFGIPPSLYRLRSMVARTVAAIDCASGLSLSGAAQAGDFADHSHAARAVKAATGLKMSEIRSLLA